MLNVGSCFSGIGGIELGLEATGQFKTIWQVENNPYAVSVLKQHWPHVKRYSDIRDVVRPEPVDVICGGFPCQDVSLAGARAGLEGKRSTLWGEMYRLICEVKPRWVLAENVPGLLSSDDGRFFGTVLRDLADAGYDAEWGMLSAAGVGAPHLRRRIFIVANAVVERGESGARQSRSSSEVADSTSDAGRLGDRDRQENVADSESVGKREPANEANSVADEWNARQEFGGGGWWSTEPDVGRVAHGVPSRVDRLKCLGNSVVPQVAQKVGEMILATVNR